MECITCITDYPSSEDFIKCQKCNFEMCYKCFYLGITQDVKDPYCLNCKVLINIEFILENSETDWLYKYFLPHLGKILHEKEKALLPYTQSEVVSEIKKRKIQHEIKQLPTDKKLKKLYKKEEDFISHKQIKDKTKFELQSQITSIEMKKPSNKQVVLISKCPIENCKGYINKEFSCEMCETEVCSGCFIPMTENHKCKIEDLQLRDLLKTHSKSCPKCYIPIIKAGGCDQMWCTNCNTAFSWITGLVETGAVHNPHYYEWLTRNGAENIGNIENIACGQLPSIREYDVILNFNSSSKIIRNLHRLIVHSEWVIIPQNLNENRVRDNIDLRIKFLLDEISEKQWVSTLITRERKRMKNRAYRQIIQMFINVATDLFRRLFVERKVPQFLTEANTFFNYIIKCFDRVYTLYGGYHPRYLQDFWDMQKIIDSC